MFWRISDINNIVGGIDHATFSALSPVAAWSGHSVTLVTDIGYSMWRVMCDVIITGINWSSRCVSPNVTGVWCSANEI